MTPKLPQPRRARRAAELKRLRELNGVSGRTVAKALGVSQSAVSRKEAGEAPVSLPEVTAWAGAIHASEDDRGRLLWMAEQAVTETIPLDPWRAEAGAAGVQQEIGKLERASRFIANFQPDFVPGLLQTVEYARRVLAMAGNPDPDAAALKRLDRQAVLHDPSHRLEFIVTEAGLRWCTGPTDMLVPQLDRVASLATLRNVTVRVIPLGADWRTAPPYPFVLYDERDDGEPPVAVTELPDQRIETANVEPYRSELDKLRRSALSGDEAIAHILGLARGLSGEQGRITTSHAGPVAGTPAPEAG
jgi:transcriptional regulator with XRE-family HTH domain